MAKAKKKASKKKALKKLRSTSYEMVWDKERDNCVFAHHGTKVSCSVMCGVTDAVSVFTDGKLFYVVSINYDEGYAALEIVDGGEEPVGACFADPKDVKRLFKGDLEKLKPIDVAKRLAKECS